MIISPVYQDEDDDANGDGDDDDDDDYEGHYTLVYTNTRLSNLSQIETLKSKEHTDTV